MRIVRFAAAALAVVAFEAWADEPAADLARKFCAQRIAGDEEATRALLTRSLRDLLAEAEERNAIIQKGAPDEKPPLGDGVPYQSFPDRAPTCAVGAIKPSDNGTIVEVAYSFPGQAGADWTDRLVLRPEDGALKIDDVLFQSFPTDTYQSGLRSFLSESFDL